SYQPWTPMFPIPAGVDIVINATSIGLYPAVDQMPDLDARTLRAEMVVADGIHNPPLTPLLRTARAQGCRIVDGLGMLVNQGVIGIRYWTGLVADAQTMRRALLDLGL
ncbi:MAG TPA: hypothetical protein VN289_10370, partial [Paraburkholderia sp.]|nr:hypothetical protein [Paraburkholderia sp.]